MKGVTMELDSTLIFTYLLVGLAGYVYQAVSLMVIANKTGTDNSWMAWIPVLNLYLMCKVGDKPGWWLILFFIPLVNIVFAVLVWMAIAEARGFASWWGIMTLVPFVNIIVPGYLAFAEGSHMTHGTPAAHH